MTPSTADGAAVECLLRGVLSAAQGQLGPRLESAYAIGSLGHGGFAPSVSDVDVALILDQASSSDGSAIGRVVQEVQSRCPSDLADRLSVFWCDWDRLKSGDYGVGRFPAPDRLDLACSGRHLLGPDLRSDIAVPDEITLLVAVARFALAKLAGSPSFAYLDDPRGLAGKDVRAVTKIVLFPVRFLYTAATGRVDGNNRAAVWYCRDADRQGIELVARAIQWRTTGLPREDECSRLLDRYLPCVYDEFLADYARRLDGHGHADLAGSLRALRERTA